MALTDAEITQRLKEIMESAPAGVPPLRFARTLLEAAHFDRRTAIEEANAPAMPPAFETNWPTIKAYLLDSGGHHDVDVLLRRAEAKLEADNPRAFWRLLLHVYKAERLNRTHITRLRPGV